MVDFANYLMPINYDKGIKYEYESVRGCWSFDVSHMGVFKISGVGADLYLDRFYLMILVVLIMRSNIRSLQ